MIFKESYGTNFELESSSYRVRYTHKYDVNVWAHNDKIWSVFKLKLIGRYHLKMIFFQHICQM